MNAVDIAVIVVLLASGIFALFRGFVHEVLAVAGWVAALLAAFWGLPLARPIAHRFVANQTLADIGSGIVIFLVVLLVVSFITHAVARQVQKSAISSVDRALGFLFGLARGVLLCSLAFMVVKWLVPEPSWLQDARTRPLLEQGARLIEQVVPEHVANLKETARSAADAAQEANKAKGIFEQLQSPQPHPDAKPGDAKSPDYDRQGLERLIENTNGK